MRVRPSIRGFLSDSGFTYNSLLAEFVAGKCNQVDQTPLDSIFAAKYTLNANLDWRKDAGSLTAVLNGAPTFVGGEMVCAGSQGAYYDGFTKIVEMHALEYRPNYSGAPAANVNIASCHNGTDNNDRWAIAHALTGSTLRLFLYDNTGTIVSAAVAIGAAWSPTAGQKYKFELVLKSAAGTVDLYIDDSLHGSLNVGSWTRGTGASRFYIGASPSVYNDAQGSFDNYIYFDSDRSALVYTIPDYIYFESNILLPTFIDGDPAPVNQYKGFSTLFESGSGLFVMDGKYWNGSIWDDSDYTPAQANDTATINANIDSLPVITDLDVTMIYENGNTLGSIDSLIVEYDEQKYTDTAPRIIAAVGIVTNGLLSFEFPEGYEPETPAGTSVGSILEIDGQDKYWDGAAWVDSSGASQTNSEAEISENLGDLDLSAIESVKYAIYLFSDGSATPEIFKADIGYNFAHQCNPARVCVIFECFVLPDGNPESGVEITFTPNAEFDNNGNIVKAPIKFTTGSDGKMTQDIVESATSEVTYTVKIKRSTGTETYKTVTVPDQDTAELSVLLELP